MTAAAIDLGFELPRELAHPRTLVELDPGECARVVRVEHRGELGERLLEMGLTPGTEIRIVREGPGGDPLQLHVRGALLSVRRELAASVRIERP